MISTSKLLVPLLANRTGFQRLELELGGRWSDYEHTDKEETYKALINWEINDWFRLRGGFNRATRAPNLGELFLNPQEIFQVGGNNFGDPCGLRSIAPYGAGGTGPDPVLAATETQPALAAGQTAAGAQSARLICEAKMGPAAATQFYTVADATGGAGGLFNWVQQTGNPNLTSETADTWTFGFVMNSPFEAEWLSGMTLSFDYYKVEIEDAIMLYSVDYANFRCYGSTLVANAAEAAAQAATPGCHVAAEKPDARWTADDLDLVRQPGHDRDRRCGHRVELELPAAQRQRVALDLAGDLPRLLRNEAVARRVRRPDGLGGLARPEPLGYQSGRLRLPAVQLARLLHERLGRQPALALPAVGQFGRVRERTGHQGEQRRRSGRWRGHHAELHAAHGHRDR